MSGIDHVSNCMTFALSAAEKLNILRCRTSRDNHELQLVALSGIQAALIAVEEARQHLKERSEAGLKRGLGHEED